ncbi:hypothetical protein GUITHDRAFT_154162 [Guillardia theta CCMP2712]|uniref:RAP domain-containing protein n=1 Tax=Guillardia theta (strain CCMP2712) TaxID=905079 RepID=L1IVT9_GUITC|nr:hypothetical protein GUITHDRAFT_154162 [Guillardia theta CCMP2712]EKX40341.1 hypothetical protein GUITHDRAFT_154162 [Guillardia theta CCMP2712]|eukprot:XP_005827321.1 hypothetical protein GUITHDRAFT_154162 [Guillardia theta CCMP2712]
MSYKIKTEVIDEKSGYSIDIVIRSGEGVDEEHPIAVEVDGPGHYMRPGLRELVGGTKMKTRHLCRLGWKVVAIPYWEWNEARDAGEEERYLSQRIAAAASSP